MSWKFWNRNKKSRNQAEVADAQTASPSGAATELPMGLGFPLLRSPKEILGLQQLIGNQEVLRMLDPGKVGRVSNTEPSGKDFAMQLPAGKRMKGN